MIEKVYDLSKANMDVFTTRHLFNWLHNHYSEYEVSDAFDRIFLILLEDDLISAGYGWTLINQIANMRCGDE